MSRSENKSANESGLFLCPTFKHMRFGSRFPLFLYYAKMKSVRKGGRGVD
ncbi:hypothetical protein A0O32_0052 [Anoxybacillus flavithermus]|uniref:Uncharacterized protein n=1 Tax=Anoxybacillus flavithermus TaxID=33934 RepID=A0A178T7H5_9BACL|nr:hypothetical protein TAF16_2270 [Anoxybacillus flavithermus]OAO84966.1 hypothetical protein A0O32_0052 [Anoxybacillus flavithermus]